MPGNIGGGAVSYERGTPVTPPPSPLQVPEGGAPAVKQRTVKHTKLASTRAVVAEPPEVSSP